MSDFETPPVPPNCIYFRIESGEVLIRCCSFRGPEVRFISLSQCLTADPECGRMFIAAVAEVAWRKEADKLVGHWKSNQYADNARAWREWGDAKHENHVERTEKRTEIHG